MTQPLPASPAAPPVPGLPSRTASLVLALLTAGAAAVITLSPFLPWGTSALGGDWSASGFTWFEDEEADWVLGAIPDGVPMLLLGLALLAVAGMTVLLTLPGRTPPAGRSALAGLHIAATLLSGMAFLWYVLSYGHFDSLYGGFVTIGGGLVLGVVAAMTAGSASALALLLSLVMKGSSPGPVAPAFPGTPSQPATPRETTHG